jgi:hypothetical protein
MWGENLSKILSLPLFEETPNSENRDSKSCEQGKQSPSFLHDYNLPHGGIYSPLSSPVESAVSDSGK